MLKVLIKKQFAEMFRGFFYDQKKKAARTKGSAALMIVFYIILTVGVLGSMFTAVSLSMCGPLVEAQLDWLYFAVLGLISVFLGVFGSVFSTYQGLYLAKDNDQLLSMPIPVRLIMISRLTGVYLLGLMYSALVILPAIVVYLITAPFRVLGLVGCIVLLIVISLLVMALSCALGWAVAKISVRLKNKSFITVLLSLTFLVLYYVGYYKATDLIRSLVSNAAVYAEKIKGAAYGLYLFGKVGEGDLLAMALFAAVSAGLFFLTWHVLSRSFLQIVSAGAAKTNVKYRERRFSQKSPDAALCRREFARFFSSPNYMLNCGLGTLLLPAAGVALLLRGNVIAETLASVFGSVEAVPLLICAAVCMIAAMNDISTPSVSLEGKSLWLVQSLPVTAWQALRAKLAPQLLLTLPTMAFCVVCGVAVTPGSIAARVLCCLTALAYGVFSALFGLFLGVRMPNLDWTNETVPIKQSMNVMISLFGGWGFALLLGGGGLLLSQFVSPAVILGVFFALLTGGSLLLLRWLKTKGAALFETL